MSISAKLVSIRWDLIPWALLLDCDVPLNGGTGSTTKHRGWFVFDGVGEISVNLMETQLPNGIFCSGDIYVAEVGTRLTKYAVPILLPTFSDNAMTNNPHSRLRNTASSQVANV